MTGKSYKLEFKISYDDGEKSYETDKYVFVKTTAKEKPSENQGGNANGGEINNGNTGNGSGGSGNAQGTPDDSGAVFGGVYTSDPGHGRRLGRRRGCVKRICSAGDCNRI